MLHPWLDGVGSFASDLLATFFSRAPRLRCDLQIERPRARKTVRFLETINALGGAMRSVSGVSMKTKTQATRSKTPMLFSRQRQLLALLDALGGSAKELDFQSLLFLYSQETDSGRPYDFVPYRYGAFSFTSYADRRKLIERGYLEQDEDSWTLTSEGKGVVPATRDMQLSAFVRRYAEMRGDELVALTYREFPFTATRSEIAGEVLNGDDKALAGIQKAKPRRSSKPLQTIGYEGHSLESYLNTLLKGGITILCDVRRNPISRKYGFSKKTLQSSCEAVGLRYEHVPELGIASSKRKNLDSQEDYDALFKEYEANDLAHQGAALDLIHDWMNAGERVALTCYEHLPHQCHRHCVAEALAKRFGSAYEARHL